MKLGQDPLKIFKDSYPNLTESSHRTVRIRFEYQIWILCIYEQWNQDSQPKNSNLKSILIGKNPLVLKIQVQTKFAKHGQC